MGTVLTPLRFAPESASPSTHLPGCSDSPLNDAFALLRGHGRLLSSSFDVLESRHVFLRINYSHRVNMISCKMSSYQFAEMNTATSPSPFFAALVASAPPGRSGGVWDGDVLNVDEGTEQPQRHGTIKVSQSVTDQGVHNYVLPKPDT